jgi:NADH:ubiquinone oxidoreductase subunit 6 (subunit J)
VVQLVCGAAIAGMIVSSAQENNDAALVFGLVAAVAVLCLMVATLVGGGGRTVDDTQGARVEALVEEIVALGVDERTVRNLVREAVRLGRSGLP